MERNQRKTITGIVVSNKMDKTVVVAIYDRVQHPLYKKIVKRTAKIKAQRRRPRLPDGNPSPVQGQEMESRRDHRKGEIRFCEGHMPPILNP